MTRIQWGRENEKQVQGGLDRGVLYPWGRPAVAWNGLVSVNESGSQESSSYYIDGRKYLTKVTPREYSATLSAVTFPDEFAAMCGILEAGDGLYLDEQVPDQFGLCYRTRYGDGKNYKLHLIYGVTATISDTQYETIGSSNDATPFEFEITGTPQSIAGYRPTAHIIVDSRNLDDRTLADIENLLYGTYGVSARLPEIQTIHEMTNFGDIVTVTDNFDGTWQAEGSYRHFWIDEFTGRFTLDNVTVNDHGDGTYEIASTDEDILSAILDGGSATSSSAGLVSGGGATSSAGGLIDGGSI